MVYAPLVDAPDRDRRRPGDDQGPAADIMPPSVGCDPGRVPNFQPPSAGAILAVRGPSLRDRSRDLGHDRPARGAVRRSWRRKPPLMVTRAALARLSKPLCAAVGVRHRPLRAACRRQRRARAPEEQCRPRAAAPAACASVPGVTMPGMTMRGAAMPEATMTRGTMIGATMTGRAFRGRPLAPRPPGGAAWRACRPTAASGAARGHCACAACRAWRARAARDDRARAPRRPSRPPRPAPRAGGRAAASTHRSRRSAAPPRCPGSSRQERRRPPESGQYDACGPKVACRRGWRQ